MRLRQVALVARDLEKTVGDLCAVFDLDVGFRDPGVALFGLANAVLPVGDTFLEVVSPVKPDASAARLLAKRGARKPESGEGAQRATGERSSEGCGYMVIVQTEDLERARERMAAEQVRIVFEHAHPAGHTSTIHLHPSDTGGAILSLDESNPPERWDWAGPEWEWHGRTGVVAGIAGATLASDAPAGLAARWAAVLDRPASALGGSVFAIELDQGTLRFVPARDRIQGLVGVDLVESSRSARAHALTVARARGLRVEDDAVWIAGTALRLIDAPAP